MKSFSRKEIDLSEEISANRLFISLFYLTIVSYDTFRFFIDPVFIIHTKSLFFDSLAFSIATSVIYFVEIMLLPYAIYLMKEHRPFAIKYLYFGVFIVGSLTMEMIQYTGTDKPYGSGSPVELFFVLFSPIFVNRRYYLIVISGVIIKYAVMGIYTESPQVTFPIMMLVLFSLVTFIILNRFNSYLNSLENSYEQAASNEKLAFIGRIATGVTHEIKNPLTSLKGFVQLQETEKKYNPKYSKIILQELERLNIIVNDLMVLGKPQVLRLKSINLISCLNYVIDLVEQQAENNHIAIYTDYQSESMNILGDAGRLKQVFLNIIKNAMEAMPDGGEIRVKANRLNDWTIVQIIDRGVGISEEDIPKLDQAFYSTKEDGTGLGLVVSHKIIEEHNGKINIESEVDAGTTFSIQFPTE